SPGYNASPTVPGGAPSTGAACWISYQISGVTPSTVDGRPQTLLTCHDDGQSLPPLWIGLTGCENRLMVLLSPASGRSPHSWQGPTFPTGERFVFQIAIHTGMGPGGILWRRDDNSPWSSLTGASPWGADRLSWPRSLTVGHDQRGA